MAFQLDHNIFFNALGAQQQNQKTFFDSLAQGIQAGQNAQALDLKKRQILSGSHLPAPIQTGTKMHELEMIFKDPARSPEERERALSLYNHIGQAGKTYGFDRGISYGMEGQQSAWPMISGEAPQAAGGMFEKLMPPSDNWGDTPGFVPDDVVDRLSVADLQSTGDPAMDARRQKMYAQNASAQQNGDPLRVTVSPGAYTDDALSDLQRDRIGPRQIPGFFESTGGGKATEKRMETQAQKDVELAMEPLIETGVTNARNQSDQDYAREIERQRKLGQGSGDIENQRASESSGNQKVLPIIAELSALNEGTYDMPYAGATQPLMRLMPGGAEAETNLDLMQQARLNLAAPLAKELGVNPTDKDFQASLDRIFDINASKQSRQAQIEAMDRRIRARQRAINGGEESQGVVTDEEFYGQPEPSAPQQPQPPKMGDEVNGFVFLGGDPNDKTRWKQAR